MKVRLLLGILVPILYFGVQLVAAQFYPGYSFARQSASELGSDRSQKPAVLNTGAITTGILTLIAATAFPAALRREGVSRVWAWAVTLAMLSMGAGAIWAGWFSLPDPRHNPRAIGIGAFLLPFLFAIALRRRRGPLRAYLFANLALFLLMIPVMSTATDYRGALQRVAAMVLYLPVGVVSAALLRARSAPPPP